MTSEPLRATSATEDAGSGESHLLLASEAAEVLRVGTFTVLELCRSGELRAYKPNKAWLIYRDDLDAYIKAHPNRPADAAEESA